jgi:hypothetical protein
MVMMNEFLNEVNGQSDAANRKRKLEIILSDNKMED